MITPDKIDKGFTLLELMITLGVAAIIATFAMPVYREQVARGHRLEAVTALYRAAQYVESARTVSSNDSAAKLPVGYDQAPAIGTVVYVLRMLGESEQNGGYSIEAQPVDANDECGIYSLDATGVRSNRSVEKLTPPKVAACWSGK
jgi:type IV pilus assembly protein PilE